MIRVVAILFTLLHCMHALPQGDEYAALIRKGLTALEQDSLAKAEGLLLQAIDLRPTDKTTAVLYQHLGQLRARQNQRESAVKAFTSGLTLAPTSESMLLDRASVYMQMGKEAQALDDLCDILALNHDNAEALFLRAYIYTRQHLNAKARTDYEHLITLQPRNRQARLGLALLCEKDKRPREAMEHIDVLLRYWPDDASVYAVRGGLYQGRRQYEQALKDLNKAISIEPENPDFYISRALLYRDFHKKSQAVADFRKAIALGASPEECAGMMLEADTKQPDAVKR